MLRSILCCSFLIAEKVFDYYLYLPPELRMMLINEMEPGDRCRFTRCSKLCNKEAKASKNYIYELEFTCKSDEIIINVTHENYGQWFKRKHGYRLHLQAKSGKQFQKYKNVYGGTIRMTELESSVDMYQCAIQYFNNLLQCYGNTIKSLKIDTTKNINFEIESLRNLEVVYVYNPFDFQQIFSKLHRPLKKLVVTEKKTSAILDYEQVYQVQEHLKLWPAKLDNQQFIRLSASNVDMGIGKLKEEDIFNFILAWQNATIGKEIRYYYWRFHDFEVHDNEKLLKLLGFTMPESEIGEVKIKHNLEEGKTARLSFSPLMLNFYIK